MKLYIGCDHAAFVEKELLKKSLETQGIEVEDKGTYSNDRCDYPDFAGEVAKAVSKSGGLGIILCGSGIGVSMVANRYRGVRAALCRTPLDATLSKQHNNSNIICLGARINSEEELRDITKAWLDAEFEEGRHTGRVAKFNEIGEPVS